MEKCNLCATNMGSYTKGMRKPMARTKSVMHKKIVALKFHIFMHENEIFMHENDSFGPCMIFFAPEIVICD